MTISVKGLGILTLFFCLPLTSPAQEAFQHQPDIPHCLLIILNEDWAEPGEISATVVRYNLDYYRDLGLEVSLLRMPYLSNIPVIYVREFANESELLYYYRDLLEDKPDFMQMNIVNRLLPLSNANYNQILLQRSLEGYDAFFRQHYAGTAGR